MDAKDKPLLDVLQSNLLMEVPIFQRNYSWTEDQCEQLWSDIVRAGQESRDESKDSHFLGTVVLVQERDKFGTRRQIIDGQQRLTTVTLLLSAMVQHLSDHKDVQLPDEMTGSKIRNYFIVNSQEDGEKFRRIHLSQSDEAVFDNIIGTKEDPTPGPAPQEWEDLPLWRNFRYFQDKLMDKKPPAICDVWRGIQCLKVILTNLQRDIDEPQLIFESMNSTGLDLTQSDLIRNFVLMGLDSIEQARLYNNYWCPMEQKFVQHRAEDQIDAFVRHYLTYVYGDIPRKDKVYEEFKEHVRRNKEGVQSVLSELHIFSGYFEKMEFQMESDKDLCAAFRDIANLRVDVAFPLLLRLYDDYARRKRLDRDSFIEIVRLVEAYVFRRVVCEVPTSSLNKTFASMAKALPESNHLEFIRAQFQMMRTYREFPSDDRFAADLVNRDMYHIRSRTYWLGRYENHGSEAIVDISGLTVEHILPQNPKLNQNWQDALGSNWQEKHRQSVHKIGNLTLTGPEYNSKYSDSSFTDKRDMKDGFRDSKLNISHDLRDEECWNVAKINARSEQMAKTALEIWPSPNLDAGTLAKYQKTESVPVQLYSIDDHPGLTTPPLSLLFDAFREEVMRLDPVVIESFKKNVVSYRSDAVFARVRAQKNQLRVEFPVPLADVDDPKEMCRERTFKNGTKLISIAYKDRSQLRYIANIAERVLTIQTR